MTESTQNSQPWFFSLDDQDVGINRKLAEGINTRIFVGEQAMLSVVQLEPNATGKIHAHPQEQWGIVLEGSCTRIQGDEQVEMTAGNFWYTPGGVEHGVIAGPEGARIIDVFTPPRDEYRNSGEGFGT